MTITALMDDYCPKARFCGEHGLSYLLESGGRRALFDAGQSGAFLRNAAVLGVELGRLDAVALSHGHYDHAGGLGALYELMAPDSPPLYAGPGYDRERFSLGPAGKSSIGLPAASRPPRAPAARLVDRPTELLPGLFALPAAAYGPGEAPAPRFRALDPAGNELADDFSDELSLALPGREGVTVITGCAHRGIAAIARQALDFFPGARLDAVIGGFHLADLPDGELARSAEALAELNPRRLYCGHCTGPRGYAALALALPCPVTWLHCGLRVEL